MNALLFRSIIFCFGIHTGSVYGQILINLEYVRGEILTINAGWNVSLQNMSGANQIIYLITHYQNQNGDQVVETQSQPFQLIPGENRLQSNQLAIAFTKYEQSEVKQIVNRTGYLPSGLYQICTKVVAVEGGMALATGCIQQNCINPKQSDEKKPPKKMHTFSSSGNLSMEHYYTRQGQSEVVASNESYTRLQGQVGVTAFDLPFKAQLRLTTEKNITESSPQAVTFSFDANEFKFNLRKELEEKIRQRDENNRIGSAEDIAKLGELKNLQQILSDTSLQEQLLKIAGLKQKVDSANVGSLRDSVKWIEKSMLKVSDTLSEYNERQTLEAKLKDFQQHYRQDTTAFTKRIDSVEYKLLKLEAKKQTVLHEQQAMKVQLDSLHNQIDRYSDWKRELKQLSAKQEEYQKLKVRRDQLQYFKQQLENDNNLPKFNAEDVSHYNDSEYLKKRLGEEGLINKSQKFLFEVDELDIGTVYPQFSPLMLSGVPVNGVSVSVSPNKFYSSVVAGKMQTISYAVDPANSTSDTVQFAASSINYRMLAGRLGLGMPQGSHFYVNMMRTKIEDEGSAEQNTEGPSSRSILGADIQFPIIANYVTAQSYVAYAKPVSYDTVHTSSSELQRLAYQTTLTAKTKSCKTSIRLTTKHIGADYRSAGTPFLRAGNRQYALNVEQSCWEHQLKVTGVYSIDHFQKPRDPLVNLSQQQVGGGVVMAVKKLPYVQFNYRRITQTGQETSFRMSTFQFMSARSYTIGNWMGNSMVSYTLLDNRYNALTTETVNHQAQASQTFKKASFSLMFNLYYNYKLSRVRDTDVEINPSFAIDYRYQDITGFHRSGGECSASFALTDSFLAIVGIQLWHDPTQLYTIGERVQCTWQVSKLLQLQGRAQHNGTNAQPFFAEVALNVVW